MKRKFNILLIIPVLLLVLGSCIENEPILYTGSTAEFDATVWNAPAVGVKYPILTRVAGFGRAVNTTTDPLITRTSGTIDFRVNLISAQSATDQVLNVSVVGGTGVAGTHYTVPASITIPANSSFGLLPVTVLNAGASATARTVILQIDGNESVKPSENFKNLGISIAQN